jgi:hypothetical protein
MFVVDGTNLSLTRGDDAYLYVGASLGEGDSLEFRVYQDGELLFTRGQLPDGTFLINKADTDDLPYGNYTYEIVLINGGTETVDTTGTLTVMQEVH